jgi:hypothetical protein
VRARRRRGWATVTAALIGEGVEALFVEATPARAIYAAGEPAVEVEVSRGRRAEEKCC